jgi:hypothetical protein
MVRYRRRLFTELQLEVGIRHRTETDFSDWGPSVAVKLDSRLTRECTTGVAVNKVPITIIGQAIS